MLLEPDIDVSAVREWCVSNGVNATINPTIYRGRIRHYEAKMSSDDMFLFRFRWNEKTRTVCDNDAGPVDGNNVVPFSPCFEQPS